LPIGGWTYDGHAWQQREYSSGSDVSGFSVSFLRVAKESNYKFLCALFFLFG
jgi:hypothetical protein